MGGVWGGADLRELPIQHPKYCQAHRADACAQESVVTMSCCQINVAVTQHDCVQERGRTESAIDLGPGAGKGKGCRGGRMRVEHWGCTQVGT